MSKPEVLIVGAGLAGLSCGVRLNELGVSSQILESSDAAGGRARTDEVDGFLLDRGFQVLLTAYPEAKRVLDYEKLQVASFAPGALIRFHGKFHRFADPWRQPKHLIATALSPIASFADKLRIARLKSRICRQSLQQVYDQREVTTLAKLKGEGFSSRIIEHFFRPFIGGVFLERELTTSSRKFDFVFKMFSEGNAALPAQGMGAIADQLAAKLPSGTIRTNTQVHGIEQNAVRLTGGETLTASKVVLACDAPTAGVLLKKEYSTPWHGVTCLYFAARKPPIEEPILVLNGESGGVINNLCVPSQVAPNYAPAGQSLVSVTVLGTVEPEKEKLLQDQVLNQLTDWFGAEVNNWRHLKTCRIPNALPRQAPPALSPVAKSALGVGNIFQCGDYLDTASIQGAMISGRRAAELVVAAFQKSGN